MVPAKIKDKYIIRFTVTSYNTTEDDIKRDWAIIEATAYQVLNTQKSIKEAEHKFQSSLILSNVPQTPKIVNASFMAFYQENDIAHDIAKELTSRNYFLAHLPLTPRRKPKFLNSNGYKGLSFDFSTYLSPKMFIKQLLSDPSDNQKIEIQKESDQIDLNSNDSEINLVIRKKVKNALENELNDDLKEGANDIKKKDMSRFLVKRSSLDSKIEYIFEEVDDVEQQHQPAQISSSDDLKQINS